MNPCKHSRGNYSCTIGNQCMGPDYRCNKFERPDGEKLVHLEVTTRSGERYCSNKSLATPEEIANAIVLAKSKAEYLTLKWHNSTIIITGDAVEAVAVVEED